MKFLLILFAAFLALRADEDSPLEPPLPARIELGLENARDAAQRRYRPFVVKARARGRLYVTASVEASAEASPGTPGLALVTTPPSEAEVVACGASTVVAALDVEAGQELEVRVSREPEEGAVVLTARLAPETDDTLARARRVLSGIGALGQEAGAPARDAVERLGALLDELVAADATDVSPAQRYVADQITRLPESLRPAALEVRAAEVVYRFADRYLPPAHADHLAASALYGYLLERVDRLEEARAVQGRTVATLSSLREDDDPDLLAARLNYGGTLFRSGDVRAAADVFQPVYATVSRTRAAGDPLFDAARRSYAAALLQQGRVARAAELLRAQLTDLAVHADADPLTKARAQRDLARALLEIGELAAAEQRITEAWEVFATALPERDPERVRARVLQGQVQFALGDLLSAALTLEDALAVMDPAAPERPATRRSLARIRLGMGETAVGRTLLEEVVDALPEGHPERNATRLDLAMAGADERELQPLRVELEALRREVEQAEPADEALLAAIEASLGWAYCELGDLESAEPLQEDALGRLQDRLPESHPDVHRARLNLAWTQLRLDRPRPAARQIRAAADGIESRLRQTGAGRGTRELEALAVQSARSLGEMLSILSAADDPELRDWREPLEQGAFALVESLRNVSADRRRLTGAAARASADLQPRVDRVREAAAEIVRLTWAGSDDLFAAVKAHDAAERALFAELAEREPELVRSRTTSVEAVRDALAPDEAAVSYWRYFRTDVDRGTNGTLPPRDHYLAYVLRAGAPLHRIELGDAATIDGAVDRWRRAILDGTDRGLSAAPRRDAEVTEPPPGETLRALVLDPLRAALGDATTLLVAFDDALHTVPFDALPVADGVCVGDEFRIVSRTSLRDLTAGARSASPAAPRLLALGGLEYEKEPVQREAPPERAALAAATRRSAPPWIEGRGFKYLYDSKDEAIDVHRQFLREHEGAEAELLTGEEGSRLAFELAAPRATYLHLATHAYFAPQSVPSTRETRGGGPGLTDLRDQVRGFAPQVLCGLAFAGANRPPTDEAPFPRVMTAGELMNLDLSGCELAVLSACDTSVGVRRAGQGVASLQQALHAAGARSMITSLWEVPDAATRKLMERFYYQLWVKGDSKADALWKAKCALRDELDGDRPRYARRAWAGWVLSGDGR